MNKIVITTTLQGDPGICAEYVSEFAFNTSKEYRRHLKLHHEMVDKINHDLENESKYFAWIELLKTKAPSYEEEIALEMHSFRNSDPFDFNEDDYPLIKEYLKPY